MMTYRSYRLIGHSRFSAFLLAEDWVKWIRRVVLVSFYLLSGWVGWLLGPNH